MSEQSETTSQTETPQTETPQTQEVETAAPERPEGFPEDHWNADAAAPNWESFLPHYQELTEAQAAYASRVASLPQEPGAYALALPEDFKMPEGVPEDASFALDDTTEFAGQVRAWAHRHQIPQEAVTELVSYYAGDVISEAQRSVAAAYEALGPKAEERIEAVHTWLNAQGLSEAEQAKMLDSMTSAEAVTAFEKVIAGGSRRMANTQSAPASDGIPSTREALMALRNTPEYQRGDPETLRRVQEGYKRVHPGQYQGGGVQAA